MWLCENLHVAVLVFLLAVVVHTNADAGSLPQQPSEHPLLALILRGQAFRSGQQLEMKTHPKPQLQMEALKSVVKNLIVPLEANGWSVELLVHAFIVPMQNGDDSIYGYYKSLLVDAWFDGRAPRHLLVEHGANDTRVRGTQRTMAWARQAAPDIWAKASHFILTRIDLAFKPEINLPTAAFPPEDGAVSILFYMPPDRGRTPRIADMFYFFARAMLEEFQKALRSDIVVNRGTHELDKAVPVRVLYHSLHRVDTHAGWNPIYRMSGRDTGPYQHTAKINADPPTIWTHPHEQIFARFWKTSDHYPIPKYRTDFVESGLDGNSVLQITIALEGVHPSRSLYPERWRREKISSRLEPSEVPLGLL